MNTTYASQNVTTSTTSEPRSESTSSSVTEESSSHFFTITILIVAVICIAILIFLVAKWIIREKRLRELRHRLIPLYTFDPNEEDDWEAELLNQESSIFSQKSQDYYSVNVKEELNPAGKEKQNLV